MLEIAVESRVLTENPGLTSGEPFTHGLYINAAGNTDEFVPGATDECPNCYSDLRQFKVSETGVDDYVVNHQPLLSVCTDCLHIPFKHELVHLVPSQDG